MSSARKVLVTGANGYVASEIIFQLLQKGYSVHGTVRDPENKSKVGHLESFPNASSNLRLFKADLLADNAFDEAIRGCEVVLHTASPVYGGSDENSYVEPAVKGCMNVLSSVERVGAEVSTVVLTSSIAAVSSNAGTIPDSHIFSEKDWSPVDIMREKKNWYSLSKTLAEQAFWDWSKKHPKVKCVAVLPGFVIGRLTQEKQAHHTPGKWLKFCNGEQSEIPNRLTVPIDNEDVARAHICAFENPSSEGRYVVCLTERVSHQDVVNSLIKAGAENLKSLKLEDAPYRHGTDLWDTSKCEKLIGKFTPLDETCQKMYKDFKKFGKLN